MSAIPTDVALALGARRVEWTELPMSDRSAAAAGLSSLERIAIAQTIHELEYGATNQRDDAAHRARCLAAVLRNLLGWPSSSGHPPCIPNDLDYRHYDLGLEHGYVFAPTDSRTGRSFVPAQRVQP